VSGGGAPKMKESGSHEKDIGVIAVPSVEEARAVLLATGLFEVCRGSDNSIFDRENGVQIRLITISSQN
jgi:hypothetical protein